MTTAIAAIAMLAQTGLQIELSTKTAEIKAGSEVVFEARMTNRGRQDFVIVPQGDGMHEGRKQPLAQIQIRLPGGEWLVPLLPGCGNTNPIQAQDFRTVQPGKSIDLLAGMVWSKHSVWSALKVPGTYEVRFVYDTTAPLDRWIGGPVGPERAAELAAVVKPLFDRVPKTRIVSNLVTVKVV